MAKTAREWLLEIATAVENWQTMRKDSVEMTATTPGGAVEYIVRTQVAAEVREEVRDALPVLLSADFSEAARRIRRAATPLPPT
jgi:hypothetical protein